MYQEISKFEGFPVTVVDEYLISKGWEKVDCFNDYKWAWTEKSLNLSIIAKTTMIDDESLGNEIILHSWLHEGIYSE
jgi:hypothetical protein